MSLIVTSAAGLLTGCRAPASPEPTPTPPTTTPVPGVEPDTFALQPPGHYCEGWHQTLKPVNHVELHYVASSGLWDGTAPAFGGLESCDIRMPNAPAAAAARLDFVWLKLTIAEVPGRAPAGIGAPALPEPTDPAVDWQPYLDQQGHTVLRGELACAAIWTDRDDYGTEPELAECDIGGAIDGQAFNYEFAATHRGVLLAASVDYFTADVSDRIAAEARGHAIDLFAAFAAAVARALPAQ